MNAYFQVINNDMGTSLRLVPATGTGKNTIDVQEVIEYENEIDIIAVNDLEKYCKIYEVKRKAEKINLQVLENKISLFKQNIHNYNIQFFGLSMNDM